MYGIAYPEGRYYESISGIKPVLVDDLLSICSSGKAMKIMGLRRMRSYC